ncbi:MAG: hypothetical protein ABL927_09835, partial [Bdellovibrionales bacterium]
MSRKKIIKLRPKVQPRLILRAFILILFVGSTGSTLLSCSREASRDLENYGDINQSPGGIALVTPAEHPGGWGRRECLLCHNAALGIHRGPNSPIDAAALN